jgi:hypothetical protein
MDSINQFENYSFSMARIEDLDQIADLEARCKMIGAYAASASHSFFYSKQIAYPPDESASREKIRKRILDAQQFFYCLKTEDNVVIGFV